MDKHSLVFHIIDQTGFTAGHAAHIFDTGIIYRNQSLFRATAVGGGDYGSLFYGGVGYGLAVGVDDYM